MRLFDAKCVCLTPNAEKLKRRSIYTTCTENMNSLAQRLNNAVASGDAESQIEEIVEILCARKYVQATKSAFGADPSGRFDESTSVRYYKYIWYLHTHDPESKDNIAVDVERIWAYLRGGAVVSCVQVLDDGNQVPMRQELRGDDRGQAPQAELDQRLRRQQKMVVQRVRTPKPDAYGLPDAKSTRGFKQKKGWWRTPFF